MSRKEGKTFYSEDELIGRPPEKFMKLHSTRFLVRYSLLITTFMLAVMAILSADPVIAGTAETAEEVHLFLPSLTDITRVLTFQDYNTRVVIAGATLLGLAAGMVGTFLLLRKRALLSDTLSHATLPGIALAFILFTSMGGEGKNLAVLIAGAALFAVLGTAAVMLIQRFSRLKEDASLGIVLSVFFGLGIALMGIATRMASGNAAGLSSFIYGKTASMLFSDALLIAFAALAVACCVILLFKELTVLCFDQQYAESQGWPVFRLDFLLMALAVVVTVIGLQAVGLILVVALLIIPAAAARFWTHRLAFMLLLAATFGALSGLLGATISALMADLPAGAVIVLTAASFFVFSLIFGSARGLVRRLAERLWLRRKIARENLLRSLFELIETHLTEAPELSREQVRVPFVALLAMRAWSAAVLRRCLRSALRRGLVAIATNGIGLTNAGWSEASRVVRNHRLWEAYLITHADVAPSMVDWGADQIEHILDRELIAQLEVQARISKGTMPASPHGLGPKAENSDV